MAFSILILLFSCVLLLGFALRSRYGLPLFLMTLGITVASIAVLFQIYSTSTYSPPGYFPFRPLEVALFRFIGKYRFHADQVQIMRSIGSFLYFLGIEVLSLLIIRNLKQAKARRILSAVIGIGLLLFSLLYLLIYSPPTAYRLYLRYYSLAPEARAQFYRLMTRAEILFRALILFMILTPALLLLTAYAGQRITYFLDTVILLTGMTLTYDILFFGMFFLGPFAQHMSMVFKSGFWFFNNAVRIPTWISWIYPFFSILLLVFILVNTNRVFSGELVLLFRKRALRNSIEELNRNLKDVLHSEKNLMFSILILAREAEAEYGSPEGLKKLERLKEIAENRMENITSSLNRIRELHLNPKPVDMRTLMDDALVDASLPQEITCERRYCDFPARCMIDEYHTRSAIKNIFVNSVEALQLIPDAGKQIVVTVNASREWVYLSIRDNGPGIAESEIRRVILPFVSSKTKNANWGIGLPYVFRIINAQLGQMRIRSSDAAITHYTQVDILLPRERRRDT
ncbi:MAG: sensor histidine kinase [Clostridia bacterium]|nr:sensor histidine kinase [Clostridia bacterium]